MLETLRSTFFRSKDAGYVPPYGLAAPTCSTPRDPEWVFREHYSRLFRSLAVALGDSDAAADATQEAFIRLCLRWWRIKRHADPAAWLRRAAVTGLGRARGKTGRGSVRSIRAAPSDLPAEPLSAFRGDIEAALARLSLPERLALVFHYMEDLDPQHIAHAMDISQEDAHTYLHRARSKLQPNLIPGPWPEKIVY